MQSSFDHYPRLLRAGLQCLLTIVFAGTASLATAQTTTLYQHNFASGLGDFSASGRVSSVSDGVRLRGGAGTSYIISSAISVAGTSNLALRVSRSTSGLDAGETATISYSFDGQNFNVLESLRSASGQVTLPISGSGSQLYLRFTLNASSILETYTINQVAVQGTGGSSGPDPEPPADCGTGLSAGLTTRNLTIDGRQRQYILSIPHSYTGDEPLPLLLDFHALHTGAAYQRDNSGMRELSEQENFIVAFPQGIDNAWNFGPCCTESRQIDDLKFARQIIDDVATNACVDQQRVYSSGYSNGGGMAYHLACNAADVVAAVAPAAFDLVEEVSCVPSRPISVYINRGRLDFIVPYRGGRSTPPTSYRLDPLTFLGAIGSFEAWGDINNCPQSTIRLNSRCDAYQKCAAGSEVVLCTERLGGHSGWDAGEAWNYLKTQSLP